MTRLAIIFSLLLVMPAWADGNPDVGSETVASMERLFLVLAIVISLFDYFMAHNGPITAMLPHCFRRTVYT